MGEQTGQTPRIIGRSSALARLNDTRATGSAQRVALVVGPAGIGKTTLLQAFRSEAIADGCAVGWGVAGEWEGTPSLWPWFEALRDIDLDQTVISAGHRSTPTPPDMAEMFRSIATWLSEQGSRTELVIMIEDLHEAEPTAVALFSYLSRRPPISGVTIIASARPGDQNIDAFRCARIALGGFSNQEIIELAHASGAILDAAGAAKLAQRTNGNPLFVQRLLEHDTGESDGPIPEDIADLLRSRIAAIPETSQPGLRALAVLGSAPVDVWKRTTSGDAELARMPADVVAIADGVASFRHGLFRDAIYADLEADERFALHARAADVLRSVDASPIALAHHLSRIALSEQGREAAEAAHQAARIERSSGALREAIQYFGIAVTLFRDIGDTDALAEALMEEAEALSLIGRVSDAEQRLIEAAQSMENSTQDRRRRLVRSYGRLRWLEEPNPSTLNATFLLEISERWLQPSSDAADRAVFNIAVATAGDIRGGQLEDVLAADRAIVEATESDDLLLLGEAHLARRRALSVHPSRTAERRVDADKALRLATQLDDHELLIRSQRMALTDALAAADRQRVSALLTSEPVSVAGRVQQALAAATVAALEGRYQDADDVLDETVKQLRYFDIETPALEFYRIVYSWDRGDLPQTLQQYESLLPLVADPALRAAVALAKAMSGEFDAAAILIDETLEILQSDRPTVLWAVTIAMATEAATAIDHPSVGYLYDALDSFGGECVIAATSAASWIGAFDRYRGLLALRLGQNADAARHLRASLEVHERMHAVPWAARSHAALAVALERLGDHTEASEHAATAAGLADEIGMSQAMTLIGDYESADRETADRPASITNSQTPTPSKLAMHATLQRQGDVWCIGLNENVHLIRHSKGLDYLARLVEQPGRDWYVLDLYSIVAGMPVLDESGTGPGLDAAAREAYRSRYIELSDTLDRSIEAADLGTSDATRVEIELLEAELVGAFGLGGRPRTSHDATEKARINVRRSISRAVSSISAVNPALGDHLDRSVRTGRFCCYYPSQTLRIRWTLTRH